MAHAVDQPTAIVKLAPASLEINLQLATLAQAIMLDEELQKEDEQSSREGERKDNG